jgi:hypothetical protein
MRSKKVELDLRNTKVEEVKEKHETGCQMEGNSALGAVTDFKWVFQIISPAVFN